jgi:2-acylglycerol O-acyltransferase 2
MRHLIAGAALVPVFLCGQADMPWGDQPKTLSDPSHVIDCAGAALVPVFVFGQTDMYSWVKLGPPFLPEWLTQRIARAIGFLPLLMYGVLGTALPHKVRACICAS